MIMMAEREGVKYNLNSVRSWYSGGATLLPWIKQQFKHYYGADILDIWGLTEAISQVTYHPLEDERRLNSTGKALPCWEIKVVDDNGNELPPNQSGEITIRGPIMKEYHNNPQATAEVIKDGWLHTGDLGSIDKDGYLFLAGTKRDMIISKGQNIYSSDIEEVLCRYYKVAKALVVGIPDRLRGEIIGTIIMLKRKFSATELEIKSFCQAHLASYKLPKKILFTKSLPKRTFNKIGKSKIWDYFSNRSSLSSYPRRMPRQK
jgi:acyl-CoA synthetase (AMP-forming)/AMP-acid ligase II